MVSIYVLHYNHLTVPCTDESARCFTTEQVAMSNETQSLLLCIKKKINIINGESFIIDWSCSLNMFLLCDEVGGEGRVVQRCCGYCYIYSLVSQQWLSSVDQSVSTLAQLSRLYRLHSGGEEKKQDWNHNVYAMTWGPGHCIYNYIQLLQEVNNVRVLPKG